MNARFISALAGVAFLASLATAQTPDPGLTRFFQAYLDEAFAMRPLDATRLGDHRFDRQLEDLSASARARWQDHTRRTLAALPSAVDYARLPRPDQIDYEILRHELAKSLWLSENTDPFADDPRVYNDYINDSIYLLLAQSSLPAETNIANAIARLAHIPASSKPPAPTSATRPARTPTPPSARTAAPSPSSSATSSNWPAPPRNWQRSARPPPPSPPPCASTSPSSKTTSATAPLAIGGWAGNGSPASSNSNSTPASRPIRCSPRPRPNSRGSAATCTSSPASSGAVTTPANLCPR
ncbi:MAG: DUF885 domain-containing protein [Verrucomicrobia bacterium]|nr:DUF885 domain-containing protein [Verrucomicrobiota bacterium]